MPLLANRLCETSNPGLRLMRSVFTAHPFARKYGGQKRSREHLVSVVRKPLAGHAEYHERNLDLSGQSAESILNPPLTSKWSAFCERNITDAYSLNLLNLAL
jgi:hypothetical protein